LIDGSGAAAWGNQLPFSCPSLAFFFSAATASFALVGSSCL
jgi:hypothetical protein